VTLQLVHAASPFLIHNPDFAIDEPGTEPKFRARVCDAAKTRRPVERFAGQQPRLAAVDARLDAIAVVFDLMNPFETARRLVAGRRKARLQEGRQQALAGARELADIGQEAPSSTHRRGT